MRFDRIWAMPSKWTFTIKPIRGLLEEELTEGNPFAGRHSPAQITNDIDPDAPTLYHQDALEFLTPHSANGVSYRRKEYSKAIKDKLARITKDSGKAICCGWSSTGLSRTPHGGSKNNTTVEIKE